MPDKYDLVVIGAGPGGYVAAAEAAKNGMKTALIEERELGGTCLNRGCIPTKTILHTTELYHEVLRGEEIGLLSESLNCDMERIQKRKEDVLEQLRNGIEMLMKGNKVTVYRGHGSILDEHTVRVDGENQENLTAEKILIAAGANPMRPPIEGLDLQGVVTSDELLDKRDVFEDLIIIGGGVIGMEFASIYSSLGRRVTVIEALDKILAGMDKEIGQNLKMILKKQGVDIHTGARVETITRSEDGRLICKYLEKDKVTEASAAGILVSVGRQASLTGLFGDDFDIVLERGCIKINEFYQTNYENIYAIGDITGGIQLAHMASAQASAAVSHMSGKISEINSKVVPACVYTCPEIGCVGMTADEAKQSGISVITKKYPMLANCKTVLSLQERGFIKVVADAESRKILGAQMMCARATDIISEFTVAIVNGLTLEQMAGVIRPHPTFCEGITEAVRE